jgi:BMFP domain-containing protein YqiC
MDFFMPSIQHLDALLQQVGKIIPKDLPNLHKDLENNLRRNLDELFSRMYLVTREEFDLQTAVLAKTRAKLTALQQRVAQLEQQLQTKD